MWKKIRIHGNPQARLKTQFMCFILPHSLDFKDGDMVEVTNGLQSVNGEIVAVEHKKFYELPDAVVFFACGMSRLSAEGFYRQKYKSKEFLYDVITLKIKQI